MEYLGGYASKGWLAGRILQVALWTITVAAVVGPVYYVFFRNWREELQAKRFLELVREGEYERAYVLWGCTEQAPCRYYPFDEFLEDWGAESPLGRIADYSLRRSYTQPNGVIVRYTVDGVERDPLFVELDPPRISFAPN